MSFKRYDKWSANRNITTGVCDFCGKEEDAKKWSAIIQNINQLRDRIDNVAKSLGPKAMKAS